MSVPSVAQTVAESLRGKPLADIAKDAISREAGRWRASGIAPRLAVVVASADAAVLAYAEAKGRTAKRLGIDLDRVVINPQDGQAALDARIEALSGDPAVHGVLLELPVDAPLDAEAAILRLAPAKDVDGLTPANLGLIAAGREDGAIAPATPRACIALAESATALPGSRATVVGRGRSVGRALIPMLINRDVTVTVCHTRTRDLAAAIAPADLVFVAAGRPGLITGDHITKGQIVIDAGINMVGDSMVGDVDAASVAAKARALTPVPGGVGPLTATLVFDNLMRAMRLQLGPTP